MGSVPRLKRWFSWLRICNPVIFLSILAKLAATLFSCVSIEGNYVVHTCEKKEPLVTKNGNSCLNNNATA